MSWTITFHPEFLREFNCLGEQIQDEMLAQAGVLEKFGPSLGRPQVDTLKGSRYSNMKELRFRAANGVWRVAFAFDPGRKGVLLVAGDKSGMSEKFFYERLIRKADGRYARHLRDYYHP